MLKKTFDSGKPIVVLDMVIDGNDKRIIMGHFAGLIDHLEKPWFEVPEGSFYITNHVVPSQIKGGKPTVQSTGDVYKHDLYIRSAFVKTVSVIKPTNPIYSQFKETYEELLKPVD